MKEKEKWVRIGIIGAGTMGQALAKGFIQYGKISSAQIWMGVRNSEKGQSLEKDLGVKCFSNWSTEIEKTQVLIVCVKPQQRSEVFNELRKKTLKGKVIVSVLAGVSTRQIEKELGKSPQVIRVMPNTAAALGESMTVSCAGSFAEADAISRVENLFKGVGRCLKLDERYFDAVTGLSGSGPAYLYLVMEALADGGVKVGLSRKVATQMIAQTMLGTAKMVLETGLHPAALRDEVTTPAGCTIGALLVLEDGRIRSVLARAVEEATRIAGKLGD